MPIYEYRCDGCGHELDALQKMADAPLTDCPACDKAELRKLISAPSFRLKGNGWYETDFKNNGKDKGKAEKKADSATSAGSSTDTAASSKSSAAASSTSSKPAASAATSD